MPLPYTVSEILSVISQTLRRSRDPEHIPFGIMCHTCSTVVPLRYSLVISISQFTKYEMPSFTESKDMIGAPKYTNGSRDTDLAH